MKNIFIPLISAALAFSSTGVSAQTQKQTPPAGGEPRNFTLPAKQEFSLPNGLQDTLVPYG